MSFVAAARALEARILGEVILPADESYDRNRAVFNARIDTRPALIVYCRGAADIIAAVHFARDRALPVATRAGGHGPAGHCVPEGGMLLDVSDMAGTWLDPERRTITVQGGVTWRDVNHETIPFGLAAPGGECPMVGVAGFTLGGGWGYLARSCGLAADSVVSAQVVTADGRLVTASDIEHPDLFWALRGGGGSFGVVASLTFHLHPLPAVMLAGEIAWPIAQAPAVIRAFRDSFAAGAPEALSLDLSLASAPDGGRVVSTMGLYNGAVADGERAFAPLLSCGTPRYVDLKPRGYEELLDRYADTVEEGGRSLWKSGFLADGFGDAAIDALVEAYGAAPPGSSSCILEVLGGAVARVGRRETAFPHRDRLLCLTAIGTWRDGADTGDAGDAAGWAREFMRAMGPFLTGSQYANYPDDELGEWRDAYYGENYARLAAVKRRYDPGDLFRSAQSIRPADAHNTR